MLGLCAGLLVLLTAAVIALGLYMGPIVKIGMQELGPAVIRVPVKMDAVDVSLLTGSAQIKGLEVGNPQGYQTPLAISADSIAVRVDPFSVLSDKIVVHSVEVKSPRITFEGGLIRNNLNQIMKNANTSSKNVLPVSVKSPAPAANKSAPKIEVDDFLITQAKVNVNFTGLGRKTLTLPLPDIHLTGLGKGGSGLTPVALTQAVLKAIISETIRAVTGSVAGIGKITGGLGSLFGK
jgi:hypothetical protein